MLRLLLTLGLLVLMPLRANADSAITAPHLRVELVAADTVITPGQPLRLGLHFELEKEWHLYWRNPGDSGQAPSVEFTFSSAADKLRTGPIEWPVPHRITTGPLANYGYENDVTLLMSLHPDATLPVQDAPITLTATVHWLVCSESCIPGDAKLTLPLPIASRDQKSPLDERVSMLFAAVERALPLPLPSNIKLRGLQDQTTFHLLAELGAEIAATDALFFPFNASEIEHAGAQVATITGSVLSLKVPRAEQLNHPLSNLTGLLQIESKDHTRRTFTVDVPLNAGPTAAPAAQQNTPPVSAPNTLAVQPREQTPIWLALLFALLGGMLLNLMPCVFPVLCIKALGLVEMSAANRREARGHGLAYSLGILLSFWALAGLLIALRHTGEKIGWGFHLQSPRFLIALSALLFLLGLNLLGVFELGIGLTRLGQLTVAEDGAKRGYVNAFATGILATVVATPCTAPFMGTAVGFALGQPAAIALLIFTALGLGLALPYVMLLWIPGLLRMLPRPGAWMETFKQIMGFFLLGTVLWLAWVLGAQSGAEGVVALLGGLLAIGVAGWLLRTFSESRVALGIAIALIVAGAFGPAYDLSPRQPGQTAAQTPSDGDLPWQPFSIEKLAAYRRAGQPVFLDFTAEWCVSCKVNERLVLRTQEIRDRMRELGVVPMKADWTNYDPEITQALSEFGRSGIPFYVVYGRTPNAPGIELPAVITTGSVLRELDKLTQK